MTAEKPSQKLPAFINAHHDPEIATKHHEFLQKKFPKMQIKRVDKFAVCTKFPKHLYVKCRDRDADLVWRPTDPKAFLGKEFMLQLKCLLQNQTVYSEKFKLDEVNGSAIYQHSWKSLIPAEKYSFVLYEILPDGQKKRLDSLQSPDEHSCICITSRKLIHANFEMNILFSSGHTRRTKNPRN
ncbi:hypothetical protein Ciccas_002383 [Cichlidogyrus casuarinus]|uniref:Uncharacterized protein n=1 Tax=Cichlidogyrus casuarinus TaxID=1844966 RepID=A0ABD2QHF6_9PLAT